MLEYPPADIKAGPYYSPDLVQPFVGPLGPPPKGIVKSDTPIEKPEAVYAYDKEPYYGKTQSSAVAQGGRSDSALERAVPIEFSDDVEASVPNIHNLNRLKLTLAKLQRQLNDNAGSQNVYQHDSHAYYDSSREFIENRINDLKHRIQEMENEMEEEEKLRLHILLSETKKKEQREERQNHFTNNNESSSSRKNKKSNNLVKNNETQQKRTMGSIFDQ